MVGNWETPQRAEGASEAPESDRTNLHLRQTRKNLEEVKAHFFPGEPDEASPGAEPPIEIASEQPPRGEDPTAKFAR
jgi:hypothetical protein